MSEKHEHQPFLSKDDDASSEEQIPRRSPHHNRVILSNIIIFLLTSLLWLAIGTFTIFSSSSPRDTTTVRQNITSNARLLTCGVTPAEARARNCKYDIFLNNWVPLPCFDASERDWITEYQEDNSWTGFSDENLTLPLSVSELEDREFYYTSKRDHVNHCGMLWNKQFWQLFEFDATRKVVDSVVASPRHTEHCARFLMDVAIEGLEGKRDKKEVTRTEVGFAGCWVRD